MLFKLLWFLRDPAPDPPVSFLVGYFMISLALVHFHFLLVKRLIPSRFQTGVSAVSCLLAGLMCFSLTVYFRFFSVVMPADLMLFADHISDVSSSIETLVSWQDLGFLFPDLVCVASMPFPRLALFLSSLGERVWMLPTRFHAGLLTISLLIWTFLSNPLGVPSLPGWDTDPVLRLSPPVHLLLEGGQAILLRGGFIAPSLEERESVRGKLVERQRSKSSPELPTSPTSLKVPRLASGTNILIVQVESLMSFALTSRVLDGPVMPFMSGLSRESLSLPFFFSQVFFTSDSDFSTLTSLYPLVNHVVHGVSFRNEFRTLPGVLASRGYRTVWASPVRKTFWNASRMNKALGFEETYGQEDLGGGPVGGLYLSDSDFLSKMGGILAAGRSPFFAMLLTFSSHHPFKLKGVPEAIPAGSFPAEMDSETMDYLNSMRVLDGAIGNFFQELEKRGLLENTLIVIYGDHSSPILSRVRGVLKMCRELPQSQTVGRFLGSRVPCLFIHRGHLPAQTNPKICGQIDLAPSILDLMGVQAPFEFLGSSVFSGESGFVANKYFTGRTGDQLFWGRNSAERRFSFVASLPELTPTDPDPLLQSIFDDMELSETMITRNLCLFEEETASGAGSP